MTQFEPEIYFYDSRKTEDVFKIHDYNTCLKNGILICPNILYFLVKGTYWKTLKDTSNFGINEKEKDNYEAIRRFFDFVRSKNPSNFNVFITPHIFTKFIHLIRNDNQVSDSHRKGIIKLFSEEFDYLNEEEIKRQEILQSSVFSEKLYGISETALLILKSRKQTPCIFSTSGKILSEYNEDFLFISFDEIVSFIKEDMRRSH
jgi:hypothetical protein